MGARAVIDDRGIAVEVVAVGAGHAKLEDFRPFINRIRGDGNADQEDVIGRHRHRGRVILPAAIDEPLQGTVQVVAERGIKRARLVVVLQS